jgi:hypothetical protein
MSLTALQRQAILKDILVQAQIALGWIQEMQYLSSVYINETMGPGGANEITANDISVAFPNSGFTPNDISVFVSAFTAFNTPSTFNTVVSIAQSP